MLKDLNILRILKRGVRVLLVVCLLISADLLAQTSLNVDTPQYEMNTKEYRKAQRKKARQNMTQHFSIGYDAMFATLNSGVRFEGTNGILGVNIEMEKHLGLDKQKMIHSLNSVYRITPRSGIYSFYYQLNRKKDYHLDQSINVLGDTISKGVLTGGYLNSSIFSFGYLLSILTEEKAFLGMYTNVYIADIKVGIRSDVAKVERSARYFAALPNIGFLARFEIKKWLTLSGSAGTFFINAEDWSATFHDINLRAEFNLNKWASINLGYNVINVSTEFPQKYFNAYVDYNYKGPSLGFSIKF